MDKVILILLISFGSIFCAEPEKLTCLYNEGKVQEEDGTCEAHSEGNHSASCYYKPANRPHGVEIRGCGCPKEAFNGGPFTFKGEACNIENKICCCDNGDKYVCFLRKKIV